MKKTIKHLITKLEVMQNGQVSGGFANIRGGAAFNVPAQNPGDCTNGKVGGTGSCSGTNGGDCTNNVSCKTDITNSGHCTNAAGACGSS